ncbi:response regulator [Fibrella sp. HMF5335]|uniref:Response regulator n=1 Tax=Fibrella rubiginis TaxID=2817060 RepID=A0A939GIE8_9BACT|nr:response regulator [Fibrella rubiginis]MBO0937038.1 response regulator [Fibrella rubiginis]
MTPHTIYIADDDEDDQFLLQTAFASTGLGCQLKFFGNGEQLLRQLTIAVEPPTLVLLDLNMPILDGFQTLAQLRSQTAYETLPVVILTTSNQHSDVQRAYEMGANSFITKPHQYADLLRTVQQLEQFWLNIAQLPRPSQTGNAADS